jgi:hypothetical protein
MKISSFIILFSIHTTLLDISTYSGRNFKIFFVKNKKFACDVIEIIDQRNFLYPQFLYLTQVIQEHSV